MALCLGDKVREARKNAGMTQRQLAEKIGVSNTSVSNWEKGISNPDPDTIQNLCWALGVQPNFFFYEELPQTAPDDLVRVAGGWMTSKAAALAAGISEDELSLIYAYRKASVVNKQIVDNIAKRYSDEDRGSDLSAMNISSNQIDIDAGVESYRKQLIDEKKAEAS